VSCPTCGHPDWNEAEDYTPDPTAPLLHNRPLPLSEYRREEALQALYLPYVEQLQAQSALLIRLSNRTEPIPEGETFTVPIRIARHSA
jgi:hypothetical protein